VYADVHSICLTHTPAHAWCSTTPVNACRLSAKMNMDSYTYIHIYIYKCTPTHVYMHSHIYIYMDTYTYTYTYICTYTHTYVYICAYAHIYIYISPYLLHICTSCIERGANVYADVHNICLTYTSTHAWCSTTPVNACRLSTKMNMDSCMCTYATVQQLLCHGSYCEHILSPARTSCRLSFTACPPAARPPSCCPLATLLPAICCSTLFASKIRPNPR